MSVDVQQALIQWFAFLLCVAAGYAAANTVQPPRNRIVWVILLTVVFAVLFLPDVTQPIIIFRVPLPINLLLSGVGVGVALNFMFRQRRTEGK